MRPGRLGVGLVLPVALVALVATLATLQYRWLGQVSEAERDQLQTSLHQRARDFADEFDREIGRAFLLFQQAADGLDLSDPEPFATQVDRWHATAAHPGMVAGLYFTREVAGEPALFQWKADARAFEPVDWPDALDPVRQRLAATVPPPAPAPAAGRPNTVFTLATTPVLTDVPALVIPVVSAAPAMRRPAPPNPADILMTLRVSRQFVIVALDAPYLRGTLLPALAARHFPERGSDRYRVAIVDGRSDAVLTLGLPEGATVAADAADAAAPFFMLRLEVAHEGGRAGYMTWRTTPAGPSAGGATPAPATASQFSVVIERRDSAESTRASVQMAGTGAWQVRLQHAAGSLDAAVAAVRGRNLALSFGILAVLAAGVGLVVLNARRSERLAAQQLDFVATVSHELRTPLAVIRSAAQNLSAGVVHDAGQARRYGDLIDTEGRRLTEMVEQVLAYAGLSGERRPASARPADVGALVGDVVRSCRPLVDTAGVEIEVDVAAGVPAVLVDAEAMRRAIHNLVTNAIKYGAGGGWIGVSARRAPGRGGEQVEITVRDRGRGIEAADLAHVFEPFYRGRYAVERQIHGNGLGLSLVKRIAEAHGGRVSVKSAPGEGAAFTIHLPAAAAAPATEPVESPAADSGGSRA